MIASKLRNKKSELSRNTITAGKEELFFSKSGKNDREANQSPNFEYGNLFDSVKTEKPVSCGLSTSTGYCPFGGACHTCPVVQTKLKVSNAGDKYEQEADRVAEQVMKSGSGLIQRKSCSDCKEDDEADKIMPKSDASPGFVNDGFSSQLTQSNGMGRKLPDPILTSMENSFNTDFSKVRVHDSEQAAYLNNQIRSQAFTYGNDIYFNGGYFQPESKSGQKLIAHELTHVIQQNRNRKHAINRMPLGLDEVIEEQADDLMTYDDEEDFMIGNTMDNISIFPDSEINNQPVRDQSLMKKPKKKMGGDLGNVKEGMGGKGGNVSKECENWIKINRTTYGYDKSKGADPVEKDFLDTYKNNKEAIPIAKPKDFNKKLKAETKSPCTCIENLSIDGHGGSWSGGAQEFAPRKYGLGKRSFGVKKNKKGKLVPYNFDIFNDIRFCEPCKIILGGCYVAINKPKPEAGKSGYKGAGDALGKALSEKTGCSVKAYTGTTYTNKKGFQGNPGGKWVTTSPPEKKK